MANGDTVIRSETSAWVPLRQGMWMRPLCFLDDGYSLQLRVAPGVSTGPHRHTGTVDTLMLKGRRRILDTDEVLEPGDYLHEPAGNHDTWVCEGDEDCIIQITLKGRVEYLRSDGTVDHHTDTWTARAAYLAHCHSSGVAPDERLFNGNRRSEEI